MRESAPSDQALDRADTATNYSIRTFATRRLERIWETRNPASAALFPLSLVYRSIIGVRRRLYARAWIASYRAPVPVVVVGNISVGGNGKTPFTIWLARWLRSRGLRPGIVLRGYRGRSKQWPLDVKPETSAVLAGDEAVLLATRSGVPVAAGPDRSADCRLLLERYDCNVLLSDDGLQHLALARDYEIALTDRAGEGNGWCLPAGPLREPRDRLAKTDQVIVYDDGEMGLVPYTECAWNLGAPDDVRPLRAFAGIRVLAATAIARPARFFRNLATHGIQVEPRVFPDHHLFSARDISAEGYDAILVTEKDAVKLKSFAPANVWVVTMELQVAATVVRRLEQSLLPLIE